jgi:hypothetical protein
MPVDLLMEVAAIKEVQMYCFLYPTLVSHALNSG